MQAERFLSSRAYPFKMYRKNFSFTLQKGIVFLGHYEKKAEKIE